MGPEQSGWKERSAGPKSGQYTGGEPIMATSRLRQYPQQTALDPSFIDYLTQVENDMIARQTSFSDYMNDKFTFNSLLTIGQN